MKDKATKRTIRILSLSLALLTSVESAGKEEQVSADDYFASTLTLEEIIVTATRRDTSLQEVAASVTAVSGDDLLDKGIVNFSDISDTISGLTLEQPASAISSGVYIRGIGTGGTTGALESVGVMVDGVYQVRVGTAFSELMDIERVEILRGPQGTLFGKNTTAGVIRIFTADPDTNLFSGKMQGVMGNLGAKEIRGLVNIPFAQGVAGLRLNAYSAERDGYTRNEFLGVDTRNQDRKGYRGKLLIEPADNLKIKLSAEHHEREIAMDEALAVYSPTLELVAGPLPPVGVGHSQENRLGMVADDIDRYVVNLSWDFGSHTLTTISALEESSLFLDNDQDNTIRDGTVLSGGLSGVTNLSDTKSQTHEIQLASNNDSALKYLLGYYWQNEELYSPTSVIFGPPSNPQGPPLVTTRDVNSGAAFGSLTYSFNDEWDASIGVRYTEDEREGENYNFSGIKTFHELTYSAKLVYEPDKDLMFYFSHDKGFKSGGIQREFASTCDVNTGSGCTTPEQALWKPETTLNYELGMKSELFNNKVRLNTAAFFQTFDDFQVTQNLLGTANVIVSNAAEVETMGLEAEFTALVSERLTVDGSVTVVDAEYKDYKNAPCNSASCSSNVQDLSGETLDHAPTISFNLGGEYRSTLGSSAELEWFARADVIHRSSQQLNEVQSPETKEDGYYLLNARIGLEPLDSSWKITLWGNNLGNDGYLVWAESDRNGVSRIPGLPRTYGLTMDVEF